MASFRYGANPQAQIKLNEVNAAGTGNINPIHVNTINDATKGIQVIPHWLSSLLLIELRLAAWVSSGSASATNIVRAQPAQSYAGAVNAMEEAATAPAAATVPEAAAATPVTDPVSSATNSGPVASPVTITAPAAKPVKTKLVRPANTTKSVNDVPVSAMVNAAVTAAVKGTCAAAKAAETSAPGDHETNSGIVDETRPGEAAPALANAIATSFIPFTAAEQEYVDLQRAKHNNLVKMPRISKTKAMDTTHNIDGFDAGEKWETVKKSARKGKGKARAASPTPSLSSLMDQDRSPSPGPSRPRARFVAGSRHSPKHHRSWNSDSESEDRSPSCACSPPFYKKSRADEDGAFHVTSPDRRSPTPFTTNSVDDSFGKDETKVFDIASIQDQDPAAFISKQNPQQAKLWNKIDSSKLRVLASGFDKSTSGPKVRRAIAHHLGINPDTFNVGQVVGNHQSLIVSGLQPALAAQLLAKHGFTVPGALVRFKDFALVVPAYIRTLSGFLQDGSSPEQILATVTAGIHEKIASDQGIHALVAKYRELAPLGMSATAIAQFMAKGLWVTPFDIGVSGGDIETAYNVYIHHPSNHPSYYAKL
ncbi:hypothetical protein C8J56DRAFT_1057886 [Mycena floridula]|nr:hypothetical protein C8J56DRAFT_1057886 [Mycena floridula]